MNVNNMGGIRELAYLLPEDITEIRRTDDEEVTVILAPSAVWRKLPISIEHTTVSHLPKDGFEGTVFSHKAHLSIPLGRLNGGLRKQINRIRACGCLIRYTDNGGTSRLMGDLDYPMTGFRTINPGKKASDYADLALDLRADLSHDAYLVE